MMASYLKNALEQLAEAILDERGDELFARCLVWRHIHNYSLVNRFLIAWQAPRSRLVASFQAYNKMAKEQGHQPRFIGGKKQYVLRKKGAHGVKIWVPVFVNVPPNETQHEVLPENLADTDELQSVLEDKPKETKMTFRMGNVWKVEDIIYADTGKDFEIPPVLPPVKGERVVDYYNALSLKVAEMGLELRETYFEGSRKGSYDGKRVYLDARDDIEARFPVLLHELAHALLQHKATDNLLARRLLEGEAQATAGVVMAQLGFDIIPSAVYLRMWQVSPEDVLRSMSRICETAEEILRVLGAGK